MGAKVGKTGKDSPALEMHTLRGRQVHRNDAELSQDTQSLGLVLICIKIPNMPLNFSVFRSLK